MVDYSNYGLHPWQRYGNKKSDSLYYLNNENNTNNLCYNP